MPLLIVFLFWLESGSATYRFVWRPFPPLPLPLVSQQPQLSEAKRTSIAYLHIGIEESRTHRRRRIYNKRRLRCALIGCGKEQQRTLFSGQTDLTVLRRDPMTRHGFMEHQPFRLSQDVAQ
jgi:hypothetical protein